MLCAVTPKTSLVARKLRSFIAICRDGQNRETHYMKLAHLLTMTTALALATLSGEAQAAKIFTLTGSATGQASLDLPDFDPTGSIGSQSMGLRVRFAEPFTGFASLEFEYSYYVIAPDGTEIEANEIDYPVGFHRLAGDQGTDYRFRLPTSRTLPPWVATSEPGKVAWSLRPVGLNLVADDDQAPVSYSVTGFHAVPEPATWALMIFGFGGIGAALRRRGKRVSALA